ncbi:hypothetical protein F383_31957 [Gossypium arboreum]|uniref:Uncharacterized protein n=1 Tax=Gossypium arboreum TaxID=29729 RepID=A0A0B0PML6_GOSAR|nr:hypothetical protein F383_31957 [Gossypium arboreum]
MYCQFSHSHLCLYSSVLMSKTRHLLDWT